MRSLLRKTAAVALGLFAAMMFWAAMTVPMGAAAGPAVLAFGCLGVAYLVWPKTKGGTDQPRPV